jgi:hypothetical protein
VPGARTGFKLPIKDMARPSGAIVKNIIPTKNPQNKDLSQSEPVNKEFSHSGLVTINFNH